MTKFVYLFNEGNSHMRDLLGGKGQSSGNDKHRPAGAVRFHNYNRGMQ